MQLYYQKCWNVEFRIHTSRRSNSRAQPIIFRWCLCNAISSHTNKSTNYVVWLWNASNRSTYSIILIKYWLIFPFICCKFPKAISEVAATIKGRNEYKITRKPTFLSPPSIFYINMIIWLPCLINVLCWKQIYLLTNQHIIISKRTFKSLFLHIIYRLNTIWQSITLKI